MGRTMRTPRTGKRSKKQKKEPMSQSEETLSTGEKAYPPSVSDVKDEAEEDGGMDDGASEEVDHGSEEVDRDVENIGTGGDEASIGEEGLKGENEEKLDKEDKEEMLEKEDGEEGEGQEEEDEEESDEAPEDISLAMGKEKELKRQKNEGEQIKRVKASAKQKRKQKYELFKKQKEAKNLRKLTKFSEEGLEIVARKMAEERATKKAEKKRKKRLKKVMDSSQAPPERTEIEVGGAKIIPLGEESSRGDETMVLGASAGYDSAALFLKQSLYGNRHKRIPALTLQAKRYRNQPAKNFVQS